MRVQLSVFSACRFTQTAKQAKKARIVATVTRDAVRTRWERGFSACASAAMGASMQCKDDGFFTRME